MFIYISESLIKLMLQSKNEYSHKEIKFLLSSLSFSSSKRFISNVKYLDIIFRATGKKSRSGDKVILENILKRFRAFGMIKDLSLKNCVSFRIVDKNCVRIPTEILKINGKHDGAFTLALSIFIKADRLISLTKKTVPNRHLIEYQTERTIDLAIAHKINGSDKMYSKKKMKSEANKRLRRSFKMLKEFGIIAEFNVTKKSINYQIRSK